MAVHKRERFKTDQFKTYGKVFDDFTNRTLYKLISQHKLKGLLGEIQMGKEASIFIALTQDDEPIIVKVYSLQNAEFLKMWDYIRLDPRYPRIQNNRRKVIFSWVQREYRNLLKAREAHVSVPTPLAFSNNVILMEFIGEERGDSLFAAPRLRNAPPDDPQAFLDALILQLRRLYRAGFVHADLSAFNILNYKERPVLIDMSQATLVRSANAHEYLMRDLRNIATYFGKLKVVVDPQELFDKIADAPSVVSKKVLPGRSGEPPQGRPGSGLKA